MAEVSKQLIVKQEIPFDKLKSATNSFKIARANYYCEHGNYEKGLKLFRDILQRLEDCSDKKSVVNNYLSHALNYAQKQMSKSQWIEAIDTYREIMKCQDFPVTVYKHVGVCMKQIGNTDLALEFLKYFEKVAPDKEDVHAYLADITVSEIKDNLKAIEYYEEALIKDNNNYEIYNMLGHLYSTCYKDKYKDKQIFYLKKAYELAPDNRVVVKNLAYVYGKFNEIQLADEFYAKLMDLKPTHSDLHSYGAYLVHQKRFAEGFKFLRHRFQKEDLKDDLFQNVFFNKLKCWDMEQSIEDKHILVHFEQGFGDSIMFVRFVELLKQKCKKVSLVVQNSLIGLFKDSKLGIDIYTENEVDAINYDYCIPMMDLPIVCETTPDTIPFAEGYLSVPKSKITKYRNKYINKNNKLKIGISFEGNLASKETDRDIPLEYLYPLMEMDDVEVYSFQVEDISGQMDKVPQSIKFTRLGHTFSDWEDTACAIKCMDLIISTDNGVMNLAGALGIKTFGIFNKITEWRWFKTEGEDVGWYKSIKPFQATSAGDWETPVNNIVREVEVLKNTKMAYSD